MYSSLQSSVVFCLLALALGAVPQGKHFSFNVGGETNRMSESVEINFRKNYARITVDRTGHGEPTVMFHDYTQGLNVFKQNGQCFVMDRFDEIPLSIEDWNPLQTAVLGDVSDDNTNHVDYHYKVLPLAVDRTTLPEAVQDLCPGVIQVFVLDEISEGADPRDLEGDNGGSAEIYLPGEVVQKRVKRQSSSGTIRGGRDGNGGYVDGSYTRNNGRGTSGTLNGRYNFRDRDWTIGGSIDHQRDRWSVGGRGSYNSRGDWSVGVGIRWRF